MTSRLLLLNGLSIVCVILFHATGWTFTAMFSWAHRYRPVASPNYDEIGGAAYYGLRLVEQFVAFCIPAFLFVSGFFVSVLTGRGRSTPSARAITARIKNLVMPYLFWSALVFAFLALQGRVFSGSRYARMLLTGSMDPNYYYVPLLVQFYVLAPVVVGLARLNWRVVLGATAALQLSIYALQYPIVLDLHNTPVAAVAAALPKWLFLVHLFWFASGVVAGFQQVSLKAMLASTRWVWPASTAILFVVGVVEWELLLAWSGSAWQENRLTLVDGLFAGTFILSFLAFADVRLPFSKALADLGGKSFGIYLAHGLVLGVACRGIYHFAPALLAHELLLFSALVGLGLAVPLLLMALLQRSPLRRTYKYVFG